MLKNLFKISRSVLSIAIAAQVMVGMASCSSKNSASPISTPAPKVKQVKAAEEEPETDTFTIAVVLHGLEDRASSMGSLVDAFKAKIGKNGYVLSPTERERKTANTSISGQAALLKDLIFKQTTNGIEGNEDLINAINSGKKIDIIFAGHSQGGVVAQVVADEFVKVFKGQYNINKVIAAPIASPVQGVDVDETVLNSFLNIIDSKILGLVQNNAIAQLGLNALNHKGGIKKLVKDEVMSIIPVPSNSNSGVKDLMLNPSKTRNDSLQENVPTFFSTTKCSFDKFIRDTLPANIPALAQLVSMLPDLSSLENDYKAIFKKKDSDGIVPFESQSLGSGDKEVYNFSHLGIVSAANAGTVVNNIWSFLQKTPALSNVGA